MNFVHDDAEFGGLLRIVAEREHLAIGLVDRERSRLMSTESSCMVISKVSLF